MPEFTTPKVQLGQSAPAFSLADSGGKLWSLEDCMGPKGLVVAFICNHCPYVQSLLPKLVQEFAALQAVGIGCTAIMPNDIRAYPDDAPPHMAALAAQYQFSFPYLYDASQAIAKAYGAVCTPDFFGFDKDMKACYRGRLLPKEQEHLELEPKTSELYLAMKQVALGGKPVQEQHPSIGCSVKWRD